MDTDVNNWIGLTVGEVIELCRCKSDDLHYIDEPPGKLRAIEITDRRDSNGQQFVLEISYSTDLFSIDRNWTLDVIKKQKVMKVHKPGGLFFMAFN